MYICPLSQPVSCLGRPFIGPVYRGVSFLRLFLEPAGPLVGPVLFDFFRLDMIMYGSYISEQYNENPLGFNTYGVRRPIPIDWRFP